MVLRLLPIAIANLPSPSASHGDGGGGALAAQEGSPSVARSPFGSRGMSQAVPRGPL